MARFDVYREPRGGLVIDVQTNLLPALGTRVVVPLVRGDTAPEPLKRLHPVVSFEGEDWIFATHLMTAAATRNLGKPVGSLDGYYDRIVAAIDMLFLGF